VEPLEELVTLADPAQAATFAGFVAEIAAVAPGLRVLAAVRGDFLTRVAALPGLAEEVNRAFFLLGPLQPDGVRQAVVGPALARGVFFESPELVDELVSSAAADGGLPLLQFALAELSRERNV